MAQNGTGGTGTGGGTGTNGGTGTGGGTGGGTGTGNCPACPDFNYTSNAKITAVAVSHTVTSNSNGEVVFGSVVKAGYAKNKSIAIIVETKNCEEILTCSCCDQRLVGSAIL